MLGVGLWTVSLPTAYPQTLHAVVPTDCILHAMGSTDRQWRSLSDADADGEVSAASGAPIKISVNRLVMKLYLLDIDLENGSVCRVLNINLESSLRKHIGSTS
jgi:hypothetical protein